MQTFAALWGIGTLVVAAAIIVRNYRRTAPRLDIRAAHERSSLSERLTPMGSAAAEVARDRQEDEWRRNVAGRLPLPAPVDDERGVL